MSAEDNYRHGRAAHDQTKSFNAIHAGHFQVESNYVGMQFLDFLQREGTIHGGANDFDGGIAFEDGGNELPHQSGIIDDQDSDAGAHAMAPRGVARERRASTAGTLRMRTTVPSPRMEAPLT